MTRDLFSGVQISSGLDPPFCPVVTGVLSMGIKWLGYEVDHSHASTAKVNNSWSYTFFSPLVFTVWCLIKHRNNFMLEIYYYTK
jgi:hypothetical protein